MRPRFYIFGFIFFIFFNFLEATHGTFPVGYGTKSIGMGGIAVAYPQDTIISATNPAGMAFVPNTSNAALQVFSPRRRYSYTNFGGDEIKSKKNYFFVPNLGFSKQLGCYHVVGFSVYGQGGMNTDFPRSNPTFGHGKLGIDYMVATFAPTWAFAFFPHTLPCHSIGVAPLFAVQRLKLKGIQNFEAVSVSPDNVSNRGYDWACGIGVRIGWMGKIIPNFIGGSTLWGGASYNSQVQMTRFHKYQGLLAQHGKLNNPSSYVLGLRMEFNPGFNISFDYQRILYKSIPAFGNPIENGRVNGILLGEKNGSGFGWENISVYKVGIDYRATSFLTLRTGGSFGPIPYPSSQIDANIVSPAVVKNHVTAGLSYKMGLCQEVSIAYAHAFRGKREESSQNNLGPNLGTVKQEMYQDLVEIGYEWHF